MKHQRTQSNLFSSDADESTFSLGDSGRMVLDDMVYDPGGDDNSMGVSLVSGAFTFVSGQIAKSDPDAMALKTPVATIGIRGTSLAGKIGGEGEENSFSLLADPGGTVGEIVLTNDGGTVVLNQVGATVGITSMTQAPPAPVAVYACPPTNSPIRGPAKRRAPQPLAAAQLDAGQERLRDH